MMLLYMDLFVIKRTEKEKKLLLLFTYNVKLGLYGTSALASRCPRRTIVLCAWRWWALVLQSGRLGGGE